MTRLTVETSRRTEFVEVTGRVRAAVAESGVSAGICVVYCPHTTAGVAINENADPDVTRDMGLYLDRAIPQQQPGFRHAEGNSDSHIKSCMYGSSATLIIDDGDIVLGRWQGVYFAEFDGPRRRELFVKIVAG